MTETYGNLVEETQGWKDLVAWLEADLPEDEPKRNMTRLAEMLGLKQPSVRGWVARHSRPTAGPLREAVCRITKSSPERWMTKVEREEAKKLADVGWDAEPTGDVA